MMETTTNLMAENKNGACYDVASCVVISEKDREAKRKRKRRSLIRTVCDGSVTLFLGMQAAQKGPSFLDLQLISDTDVTGASSYFTANSFGYMVGALVAGVLFDRIDNKVLLIFIPMTFASFFISLTPWCTSYITMLLAHMISATQCAMSETTFTADQFVIWKGKSEAPLQFLSFMYSLGGVLGPLYTEPFLVPKWNETDDTVIQNHDGVRKLNNSNVYASSTVNSRNFSVPFINETVYKINSEDPPESQLYYAYMITGIFGILFSIPYYVLCCKHRSKSTQNRNNRIESTNNTPKRLPWKPYILLLTISCLLLFFYTMVEDSFNMFAAMFVVSHLSWTKENGALLSSLYWGISTISKLISVPLVRRVDLGLILLISCVGMVISMLAFLLSSLYGIDSLIWITTCGFGMSQATIFGGIFSWVDIHIIKLDGKETSVTMVFAAFGAMVGPLILGITMENYTLMSFPYTELTLAILSTFIFGSMYFFLDPYVTRKYGPVRPTGKDVTIYVNGNGSDTESSKVEETTAMMPCDNGS